MPLNNYISTCFVFVLNYEFFIKVMRDLMSITIHFMKRIVDAIDFRGDSRIEKVGGIPQGQGKSREANTNVYHAW